MTLEQMIPSRLQLFATGCSIDVFNEVRVDAGSHWASVTEVVSEEANNVPTEFLCKFLLNRFLLPPGIVPV